MAMDSNFSNLLSSDLRVARDAHLAMMQQLRQQQAQEQAQIQQAMLRNLPQPRVGGAERAPATVLPVEPPQLASQAAAQQQFAQDALQSHGLFREQLVGLVTV